jgi:hypothetical protein
MEICLTRLTDAALAMASLASMEPVRPLVSTNPMDSLMVCMGCGCIDLKVQMIVDLNIERPTLNAEH